MNGRNLPRASNPSAPYSVIGSVWNRAMDLLEEASRVSVGRGLKISETPAGKIITLATPQSSPFVRGFKDGGTQGDLGVPPTYTYTLTSLDGATVLATGLSPECNRNVGPVDYPAADGVTGLGKLVLAYRDADGWHLVTAFETPAGGADCIIT